jgi:hypothetical protein
VSIIWSLCNSKLLKLYRFFGLSLAYYIVGEVLVNKLIIIALLSLTSVVSAKKSEEIKIKTVYKRSKKIWGVYTLKKQEWSQGRKKHRIGAKEDHILLRKKGKLVFVGPEFKEGVLSYDVKSIPYISKSKKKIKVLDENLNALNFKPIDPFKKKKSYKTVSFNCSNQWKKIECTQTLIPLSSIEVAKGN